MLKIYLFNYRTVGGVDGIFAPEADEMYPKCPKYATFVNVEGADERSEGKSRKGFFRGVATVVTKLFNIVQPNYSFFGQKDGLQAIIVQQVFYFIFIFYNF